MNFKKLISAILTVVICLSLLAGCGYNPETVLTIDGVAIPSGKYLFFQLQTVFELAQKNTDTEITNQEIFDLDVDGVPAREWIANETLEKCKKDVFIQKEFDRLGLVLDDFSLYYIEYQSSTDWSTYGNTYMGNGIGYETYMDIQKGPYKESLIIQKLYGVDGEFAISTEDKQSYFTENFTRIDYMAFPTVDLYGYALDSEKQAKIGEVAVLMSAAKTNEELLALYLEHYPTVLNLTGDNAEVSEEKFKELFLLDTFVDTSAKGLDKDFVKAAVETDDNSLHHFEKNGAYYIYRNIGLGAEDTEETNDLAVVTNMGLEPFTKYSDDLISKMTVESDSKAMNYYSLDKVKFA